MPSFGTPLVNLQRKNAGWFFDQALAKAPAISVRCFMAGAALNVRTKQNSPRLRWGRGEPGGRSRKVVTDRCNASPTPCLVGPTSDFGTLVVHWV